MHFVKQLYANCLAKLEISKFLVSSSYLQCVSCYVIFFDREIYFVSTVEHMFKPVLLILTIQDVITSLSHGIFVLNFKLSLVLKRLFWFVFFGNFFLDNNEFFWQNTTPESSKLSKQKFYQRSRSKSTPIVTISLSWNNHFWWFFEHLAWFDLSWIKPSPHCGIMNSISRKSHPRWDHFFRFELL